MAVTLTAQAPETKPYTVLRPICMAGQRVEVGEAVELTRQQATELASAGKVGPLADKPRAKKAAPQPDPQPGSPAPQPA